MVTETGLELGDGRTLHAYDTGGDDGRLAVFWHHGSPNIGSPPVPLFPAAERLGIRWVSYDRPGYGGATPNPDRGGAPAGGAPHRRRARPGARRRGGPAPARPPRPRPRPSHRRPATPPPSPTPWASTGSR